MRYLIFTFLFFIYSILSAQTAPSIQWQKALGGSQGDTANSIRQTSDGGYIMTGDSSSNDGDVIGNHGSGDAWVVKLDPNGNIQWQKSLGGTNSDISQSIWQTTDGGYILAGSSRSNDGDLTANHGNFDYWIVKLDSNGNTQWQKSLGGSSHDSARSVQQTADGGYIVAGSSGSADGDITGNHGQQDYWLVKLDSAGNIQWQKSLGGSNIDEANSVRQTSDGGYIIAGSTASTDGDVTGNHGNFDYWIVKTDASGNIQWQKTMGNIGDDIGYTAQQTSDGGYIVAGTAHFPQGEGGLPDYWMIKLDPNGDTQWSKLLGGSAHDNGMTIQQTSEGDYVAGGWAASNNGQVTGNHGNLDYWITKLDSNGNLKWGKALGGPSVEYFTAVEVTSDNGYIISGNTMSTSGDVTGNHGTMDAWVVKLSPETLGISESTLQHKPNLYPNPAKDFFYLDHLPKETTISITDMSGRKLFSQKYHEEKVRINTSEFTNGIYMVQVKNRKEIILSEKISVNK